MSLSLPIRALGVLENLVGRRHLWRLGRLIYQYARRDGANIPEVNGEYALHRKLARLACQRNEAFRVIDVGANVGYWSSHLLDACRTAGVQKVHLWAFEPSEEIRVQLTNHLRSPSPDYHVTIRGEAVADSSGHAAFDGTPGITGIKHLLTDAMIENAETPSVKVPVTTLANVFTDEKIDVADFIKSDVEGFDLSVLRGAVPLLAERRIGLFQFEYNQCWISTRSFLRDVFELAGGLPYRVCKVVPDGVDAYESWHPELETFFEANYLLVRDDLIERLGVRVGKFSANNTFSAS
ncbi:MAG: FkbM family methyltransferase [Myxococcales bacterium]|nr:FkbM family methyltransferase [Myxococcales bacterium]